MTAAERKLKEVAGFRYKYGIEWAPLPGGRPYPEVWIERDLYALLPHHEHYAKSKGWLGKVEHFKRFCLHLFAHQHCSKPFQFNPHADRMAEAYVEDGDVGFVGHAGSSKSYDLAAFLIADFLADPENTGCVVTSTTLKESRLRIWGHIERLWQDACSNPEIGGEKNMPGKLVTSLGLIRYIYTDPKTGVVRKDDQRGLILIAGALAETKAGVDKMKGFHPPRLRVGLDELSDLSLEILETVETNLKNTKDCKVAAALNARDFLDAGGAYCEPKDGWDGSVRVHEVDFWIAKKDRKILRFDAYKSANVLLGLKLRDGQLTDEEYRKQEWAGLLTLDDLEKQKDNLGEDSPRFLQQYRAQWPTAASASTLYSYDLIFRSGCKTPIRFLTTPIVLAAMDPSFSHGGDRCPCIKCLFGQAEVKGKVVYVLQYHNMKHLDEGLDKDKDRNEQIVANLIKYLDDVQTGMVLKKNFAMDVTGAGSSMATLIGRDWPGNFMKIAFHGPATNRPYSTTDKNPTEDPNFKEDHETKYTKCKDVYYNRVSEMWGIGVQFMRSGQLKNLPDKILAQMTKRPQRNNKGKIQVVPKDELKQHSPDEADAFFLILDLARERYQFTQAERPILENQSTEKDQYKVKDKQGNVVIDLTPVMEKKGLISRLRKKLQFYQN